MAVLRLATRSTSSATRCLSNGKDASLSNKVVPASAILTAHVAMQEQAHLKPTLRAHRPAAAAQISQPWNGGSASQYVKPAETKLQSATMTI